MFRCEQDGLYFIGHTTIQTSQQDICHRSIAPGAINRRTNTNKDLLVYLIGSTKDAFNKYWTIDNTPISLLGREFRTRHI